MKVEQIMQNLEKKHPGESEYLQAVREVLESIEEVYNQHPEFEKAKIVERMVEPDRIFTFRVTWVDDKGEVQTNLGYRVQFNSAIGPYKGGLRFHPAVTPSMLKFLGFEQTFKNALTTLPMGGGKGGSDFDPVGKSNAEIMRFCQAFMLELRHNVGPDQDVPAGDVGVGGREIGFLNGMYQKLARRYHTGVLTGKGMDWGGSILRPEATGYGALYFTQHLLNKAGKDIKGKKVALSGFGNVAWGAAKKAKELGATTKFTATESAQAMTFMGMAGWDAEQMLDGMSGMLDLAAASGSDLGLTADIVTDNLTAFGMKAEDTAHFADVLAAAATNSNTSVEIMGETFKNSAAVAGALGYSVEDVSIAVGLMANAGVKGSIAGTSLKHTFEGLLEGVTLTSEAFGEVEVSAVKADGTMKSFGESVDELRGYFSQMSEAEKMLNAIEVAGKYGFNGLLAIVNSTQEDFDNLTSSINDCEGAASKMADVKMDNLSGQVTLMNSAMDALKNTLGSAYEDELKALAKAATDVLTKVNELLSSICSLSRQEKST